MNLATTAGAVACVAVIVIGAAGPGTTAPVPAHGAAMLANETIEVRWGIHATQHHASQLAKDRSGTGHHHRRTGQR